MQKDLLLELNEFNKYMLADAAEQLKLKNIQKLLALPESKTRTDDTYDSNFLEPWVQWVSIHSGTPSSIHRIKHLGDVPELGQKQIWEKLSDQGITCGIWGVMNGDRRNAKNVLFFLPDPWTFSETGFPSSLEALLDFPRYVSKNYLNIQYGVALKKLASFLDVLFTSGLAVRVLRELPELIFNSIRFPGKHFTAISFADIVLTDLFFRYKRKFNPDFNIIFLNSIAHLQHHHWNGKDYRNNRHFKVALKYLDRILAMIFKNLGKDEILLCMNGLSQKNTNDEAPWILCRQKSHRDFLAAAGITARVEAHMTHDAHLFFSTELEKIQAQEILSKATVNNSPLFLLEDYREEPKKLFYRLTFTDPLPSAALMEIAGKKLNFFDHFEGIVKRSGKHIPNGSIFIQKSNGFTLPDTLYNHELYSHLVNYYSNP